MTSDEGRRYFVCQVIKASDATSVLYASCASEALPYANS